MCPLTPLDLFLSLARSQQRKQFLFQISDVMHWKCNYEYTMVTMRIFNGKIELNACLMKFNALLINSIIMLLSPTLVCVRVQ
jgi:hypothetical protein